MARLRSSTSLAIAVLLTSPGAAADAIGGPPERCPPGSRGVASHDGEWCKPDPCQSNEDCQPRGYDGESKQPKRCTGLALCVEHERYQGRGPSPRERDIVRGPCQTDGDCIRPAVCQKGSYCIAADEPAAPQAPAKPAAEPGRSCGPCAVQQAPQPLWLRLLTVGSVLGLALTRRRTRPSRATRPRVAAGRWAVACHHRAARRDSSPST